MRDRLPKGPTEVSEIVEAVVAAVGEAEPVVTKPGAARVAVVAVEPVAVEPVAVEVEVAAEVAMEAAVEVAVEPVVVAVEPAAVEVAVEPVAEPVTALVAAEVAAAAEGEVGVMILAGFVVIVVVVIVAIDDKGTEDTFDSKFASDLGAVEAAFTREGNSERGTFFAGSVRGILRGEIGRAGALWLR